MTRTTRDIFMERYLYKSNSLGVIDSNQIEHDFSKYEHEIASLISNKIIGKKDIFLTFEQEQKLKLFCALLSFRSKNTKESFFNLSNQSKEFYLKYQKDGNFLELWKRNLSYLVNCRKLDDVIKSEQIDEPFKIFMQRDTEGLAGAYFSFLERRGEIDFIIGDCYPVNISDADNFKLPIFNIFPITPSLVMLQVYNGAENVSMYNNLKEYFKSPKISDLSLRYHVRKIYEDEVWELCNLIKENSKIGYASNNQIII